MTKKICLYARSAQCILYAKLGKELEKKGFSIVYIVQNQFEEKLIKREGCQGKIYNIDKYIHLHWNNQAILETIDFEDIENQYEIDSLWGLFYTDRFLVRYNIQNARKFIKLHIAFILTIIKEFKPEYLFNEEIAIFSSFIFYKICAKHKCKYYGFSIPKQFGDRFVAIVENEKSNYFLLERNYKENIIKKEHLIIAKQFIYNFRQKELVPPYLLKGKFSKQKPKIQFSYLINIVKFIISELIGKRKDPLNYMDFGNEKYLYEIKNYFKYKRQKKYYTKPDFDEKYIYFPLHYQPEATTLVNAQDYEKQQCAVDLIAKKIPGNYLLYVKEHFSILGHRDMGFYKMLKKWPNVRLIDPFVDSHLLIKKSKAVVVLTGTAGWEAILYGKPTFVLGNVFYKSFKYAISIDNIKELSSLIKNNINKKIDDYDYELQRFVGAFIASLFPGYYYLLDQEKVNSRENVKKIFSIIIKLIENR